MAFNLSNLEKYVDEQRLPLIKKAVLGAKTISLINLMTGVKRTSALNLLNTNPTLQAGGCGFSAQGDATLSQRLLNAENLKVNMEFCDKDLLSYWCAFETKASAIGTESVPFEEALTTSLNENINAKIEKLVWTGDKDNTGEFDGILTVLDGEAVKTATGTGAFEAIKATYQAIPVEVLDKAVIFVGADTFRSFMLEMVEKNFYHYSANGADVQEFVLPGTNTKVVAVNGLNGTNKVVASDPMNLFFGTDMLDDAETFEFFYDKGDRIWKFVCEFNGGCQVAYPNEVVLGTVA